MTEDRCICPPFHQISPGMFWICPECGAQDG